MTSVHPQNPPAGYQQPPSDYQPPPPGYYQQPPPPGYYQQPPPPGYYQQPPPQYYADQPVYVVAVAPQKSEETITPGGFTSKEVRLKFIRKVYLILTVELLFTGGMVALFLYEKNTKAFVQSHSSLMFLAMIVFLVVYFIIVCVRSVRRKFPLNLIMLCIVTAAESYMTATITSYYETESVMYALGITAFVTFAVSIFAMQTKYDLTKWGMILFVATLVLLLFGLFAIIFRHKIMSLVYSAIAALLFTVYLAFDTQLIMGGRSIELSPEEYILAALMLYIDIIMIFINILNLCNRS